MWGRGLLSRGLHQATRHVSRAGEQAFRDALLNPERVQRQRLARILEHTGSFVAEKGWSLDRNTSWEVFSARVPVTDYTDWATEIERQRQTGERRLSRMTVKRYQPTSGSTSKVKWIPYTQAYLSELDQAISPWLTDMYLRHPGIARGRHYWSFSWMPTELRQTAAADVNNDLQLLASGKRQLMSAVKAVPDSIALADTSDDSQFATLAYLLVSEDLSLLSVWSPTFALSLFDRLSVLRDELATVLKCGHWGNRASCLRNVQCPRSTLVAARLKQWDGRLTPGALSRFWPKLALISAWDTSTSAIWAQQLQNLFPDAAFQGKGLWATEGVVTIPYQGRYPLAVTSHFYEFQDIEDGTILPAWKLETGQRVRPLLTTGSGLLRYGMKDHLRVTDRLGECPCFEFLGRADGVDMVGEKLSPESAMQVLDLVYRRYRETDGLRPISLLAAVNGTASSPTPFYWMLCECTGAIEEGRKQALEQEISARLETELQGYFHYKLARDLGQLGRAQVFIDANAREVYQERGLRRGMISGDIKIEPLMIWDIPVPEGCGV